MIPVTEYAGRDVAVFGLGRTGLSAAKALAAGGARVHAWDDDEATRERAAQAGVTLSDINKRDWQTFAALVLSPGVPYRYPQPHRVVRMAEAVGVPVVGDMELFARAVQALPERGRPKVVGVTGTNGKSTTTALIGHILRHAGIDARVGGNIGTGVLDMAPLHANAVYVLELSSYQLDLAKSLHCNVGVFLNLSPDHLDRHGGMAVFFGRLLPTVRTFISVPAGLVPMNPVRFILFTTAGTAFWTAFLTAAGYFLESQYERVQAWLNPVSTVVVVGIAAWYLWRVATYRRRVPEPTDMENDQRVGTGSSPR